MNRRQTLSLALSLALCFMALAVVWSLSSGSARAEEPTRYVTPTGTDSGGCSLRYNPCRTIQYALDAATDGDLVKIAAGEYTSVYNRPAPAQYPFPPAGGLDQVAIVEESLTIQGGYLAPDFYDPPDPDANLTILDAGGQGRGLVVAGQISVTIGGLSITGGDAAELGGGASGLGGDAGGGVYVLSATVRLQSIDITGNVASSVNRSNSKGGGLYLLDSKATLEGNTIAANEAFDGGGGYQDAGELNLNGSAITGNTAAGQGAGLHLARCAGARVTASEISDNRFRENSAGLDGAGVFLSDCNSQFLDNTISNNAAYKGGGLYVTSSELLFVGNVVTHNAAHDTSFVGDNGGGLYLDQSQAVINNNLIDGNDAGDSGGGLYLWSSDALLGDNTITGNATMDGDGWHFEGGGGLYQNEGSAVLNRNWMLGNTSLLRGGALNLYSVQATLSNNIFADNQADTRGSGLHIHAGSVRMLHNTLARNSGGNGTGLDVSSGSPVLTNTIVVSHSVGILAGSNTVVIEGILWGAGIWANDDDWIGNIQTGTVEIWGNPTFVDPDGGDYHLAPGSAALDVGVGTDQLRDIDREMRPYLVPDLGGDEYWPPGALRRIYLPVLRKDGS